MAETQEYIQTKADIDDWKGGHDINLKRKIRGTGQTVGEALKYHIASFIEREKLNHEPLFTKLRKWEKQYAGERPPKNHPYPECNNLAIPMTKWLTKAVLVRFLDVIFSQQRIWLCKAKPHKDDTPEQIEAKKDLARKIENALDNWAKKIVNFKDVIFSPLMQGIKMGKGLVKMGYVRKKRMKIRRATPEESLNPEMNRYRDGAGDVIVKVPATVYDGPMIWPLPREDYLQDSEAISIKDARCAAIRVYQTKNDLITKNNAKLYQIPKEFLDIINAMGAGEEIDDVKKDRIVNQGKLISEVRQDKYETFEVYLRFDVDNDGEEDDILVIYHPSSGHIFRAIYNPWFFGFKPICEITPDPVEFSFDGDGTVKNLEHLQVAMDSTHNQRRDRMDQINSLNLLMRENCGLPKDFVVRPGIVNEVDGNPHEDVMELRFADVYPSLEREEMMINSYAERTVGLSPLNLGQGQAERPVARESLALIEEANKAQKYLIDNGRRDITNIGWMALELMAQHAPTLTYEVMDDSGIYQTETLEFPFELLRDSFDLDLMASSELLNQEIRREIAMTKYQIVKDYYQQIFPLVQMLFDVSGMIPMPLKGFALKVLNRSERLLEDVLREFGDPLPEDLVESLEEYKQIFDQVPPSPRDIVNMPPMMGPPPGAPPPGPQQGGQNAPPNQQ